MMNSIFLKLQAIIRIVSEYENENIALNNTGGTKLISIAAADTFNLIGKPIFILIQNRTTILFSYQKDENKSG
ncbi:DUF1887 family protein [Gallibacterium anatis]|uniref:DUF1887 family protein n=1 Tax=Gallibacterium anatis TaxID=750 RepID=A0A930UWN8_9PAST|nr:DUF1887 family protein [Gallibacterium anatis]